ncbi:hypothetical protein LENED_000295 [Lentinula edodes]|uniref:Uncharacterized protein n=1 Tax=Lentinula edodes TaxID=5353 RepID=A0A1Q3DV74_LENED|nr:hypothetical protein LENED_000295 [Lentinula edodes]
MVEPASDMLLETATELSAVRSCLVDGDTAGEEKWEEEGSAKDTARLRLFKLGFGDGKVASVGVVGAENEALKGLIIRRKYHACRCLRKLYVSYKERNCNKFLCIKSTFRDSVLTGRGQTKRGIQSVGMNTYYQLQGLVVAIPQVYIRALMSFSKVSGPGRVVIFQKNLGAHRRKRGTSTYRLEDWSSLNAEITSFAPVERHRGMRKAGAQNDHGGEEGQ